MKNKIVLILLFINQISFSQDTILDRVSNYLEEYKIEALKDSGKLWNTSFDIPIKVKVVSENLMLLNRKVAGFKQYKNIYIGKLDDIDYNEKGEKKWNGENWAFYNYPFPNDKKERLSLLFHENFHAIQPKINLVGKWTQCKHLNSSDARSLLKLEYAALLNALIEKDCKQYIIDALTFRAYRYTLYPNAYLEEQSIEILEGLAKYTDMKLCGYSEQEKLDFLKSQQHFNPQTYSYWMGAIYGMALDKSGKDWRKEITKDDNFLYLTQRIFELQLPNNLKTHIEKVRCNYGWDTISKEEKIIDKRVKQQEKLYIKMFFKNPVVKIPKNICKGGFGFKTTIIFPLADGKVYNGITTSGDWGNLTAKDEIFYSADIVLLPTPFVVKDKLITGNGWQITLKDNWRIKQISKKYYELVQD